MSAIALRSLLRASLREPPFWLRLFLIGGVIFLSVRGGLWLSDHLGRLTAIWAANALLAFFLLRSPRSEWPAILGVGITANFFGSLAAGASLASCAYLPYCNAAGVLIIALPITQLGLQNDFARPKSLCVFYALALGPAPLTAGLLGAIYFHFALGRDYLTSVFDWYGTDALCYSIIVPVLMTVRLAELRKIFSRDEAVETLLLIAIVFGVVFLNMSAPHWPLAFLFFPAVLLLTFQRGFPGGSIGLLIAGAYVMVPVLEGVPRGALATYSFRQQVIAVQLFIAVLGFLVLMVGAALAERRRLEEGLAAAIVRAESAREEAVVSRDAALQANRMKSMFLATMSHELRTPLNAIIGFSELMHKQLHGEHADPRYLEYSNLIENAGRHLLSLINDVLDMSKIEAGKFELHRQRFDARDIIHDCVTLMRERASNSGLVLVQQLPPTPLLIEADMRAIKQILLNLLSNGIKFTPDGGRVTVSAGVEGDWLVLRVRDTGIGIPSDQLGQLGNPFVQVRTNAGAAHEGTGLGLALVRALSEIHGGSFRVDSVLDRGTTVSVMLPMRIQDEAVQAPLFARAG